MTVAAIVELFEAQRSTENRYRAKCPVHKGKSLSLALYAEHDRVQITCFAGCSANDIWKAVGLTWKDSFYERRGKQTPEQRGLRDAKRLYENLLRSWSLAAMIGDKRLMAKTRRQVVPLGWYLKPDLWLANGYTPMMTRWVQADPARAEKWATERTAETLRKRDKERETNTTETEVMAETQKVYFAPRGAVFGREEVRAYLVPR